MSTTITQERRQSFRIEDSVQLELVPLTASGQHEPLSSHFKHSQQFQLLNELQLLDQELQYQLFKLSESNTVLANALQLINKKIERLALQTGSEAIDSQSQPITFSEGGLSLTCAQPLAADTPCAVRIKLFPEGHVVQRYARVIYCLELDKNSSRIGLSFTDQDEAGANLIARHILTQQALNRRSQRNPA